MSTSPGENGGPASGGGNAADSAKPSDIKLKLAEQQLRIAWADDLKAEFPLAVLRSKCPCATCRTEREGASANPLKILKGDPTSIKAVSASLVGNYAIQLFWSDGHQSGIYEYRFLRDLAEKTA